MATTGTTTGYTQQITTLTNGIIKYTYGENVVYIKQSTHVNFTNYMQVVKSETSSDSLKQGFCTKNFRLMLADVKQKGFFGVIIFEKNPQGVYNLTKAGKAILESDVTQNIMSKQIVDGSNVYVYVTVPPIPQLP
jgi:hypothetical protein